MVINENSERLFPGCCRLCWAIVWIIFVGCCPSHGISQVETDSLSSAHSTVIRHFVDKYCLDCHDSSEPAGDLSLVMGLKRSKSEELKIWEKIRTALGDDKMPPEDADQPSAKEKEEAIQLLDKTLRAGILELGQSRVTVSRRLTNFEYQNTMRDLLGFELKLIDNLPKDPVKPYRFNNTAEFMRLGPEQVNRYLECARLAMKSAIVDPIKPEVHRTRREWKAYGLDRGLGADEVGVWGNRRNTPASGMGLKSFPETGEYRVRVKTAAILPEGIEEVPLRLVMGYGLGVNSSTLRIEPIGSVRLQNSPDEMRVVEFRGRIENHPAKPGKIVKGKRRPDSMVITPQNLYDDGTLNDGQRQLAMPRIVIEWMEFEAPIMEDWPPKHHTRILFESPLRQSNPDAYVAEVLRRFMSRAYRRPATEKEVSRFKKIFKLVTSDSDSFEAAMRETLAMVLISPQFLYHNSDFEDQDGDPNENAQYVLASRLSYFLWKSMPDQELLTLASNGELNKDDVIQKQVLRMLSDPRSRQFLEDFTMQWLSLAKMKTVPINRDLFPRFLYYVPRGERAGTEQPYRPTIRDYLLNETVGFIGELIRRNAAVGQIVDSDFVYVNQPLAAHYGLNAIQGNYFRPVEISAADHLGGLLTQGSVLIGNGTGTAPHPIYRAVWLREAILGDEVPAPPADVPALSDSAGESAEKALSIKGLLQKHRQKPSCHSCHAHLDPWGIPFEHYNAIGKYQPIVPKEGVRVSGFRIDQHVTLDGYRDYLDSLNEVAVDASTKLPQGPDVEGMEGLKTYLLQTKIDDIGRNLVRRLLSYGVGRELDYRDYFEVKDLMSRCQSVNYRMKDMIVLVCQSDLFRNQLRRPKKHTPKEK